MRASEPVEQGAQKLRGECLIALDERDCSREGARIASQYPVGQRSHASNWRAITRRWISLVPSPIVVSLTSRKNFSAG